MEHLIWETKPTNCPVCEETLKPSQYAEDGLFCEQRHGKVYPLPLTEGRGTIYAWYPLRG